MNRRSFLANLITVAAVISTRAVTPSHLTLVKHWKNVRFTGWHMPAGETKWVGKCLGERSDGGFFYTLAVVPEHPDQHTIGHQQIDALENARVFLDTFLNCSCTPDHRCEQHRLPEIAQGEAIEVG